MIYVVRRDVRVVSQHVDLHVSLMGWVVISLPALLLGKDPLHHCAVALLGGRGARRLVPRAAICACPLQHLGFGGWV